MYKAFSIGFVLIIFIEPGCHKVSLQREGKAARLHQIYQPLPASMLFFLLILRIGCIY